MDIFETLKQFFYFRLARATGYLNYSRNRFAAVEVASAAADAVAFAARARSEAVLQNSGPVWG